MAEARQWTSRRLRALAERLLREVGGDERQLLNRFIATMRSVRDLPTEHEPLSDPEAQSLAKCDDALGQFYQALSAPKLAAAYRATARQRRKFRADEIPAVTQLFTPRWVVEFLLQNTLGRLWWQWHPDSMLPQRWPWLIQTEDDSPVSRPRRARDIRILDPACGTMNFGVVAIEMLDAMYREEMACAGERGWTGPSVEDEQQIGQAIAQQNLFGIDVDPIALELARVTLDLKRRCALNWNLQRADTLFCEPRPRSFDVIVTNPPYLSARNIKAEVVARMKARFPASWRDQYACFIERSIELLSDQGMLGILAMQSFMFTGGFEQLRRQLADTVAVRSIAHFGPGLFDVGNPGTLQTVAVTMRKEPDADRRDRQTMTAIRLVDVADNEAALREKLASGEVHRVTQRELFDSVPRCSWSYWLTPPMRHAFATFAKLRTIAPPRQGLATTDNARFVRWWWEVAPTSPQAPCVASPNTWFGYVKSGRFRRWYEAPRHRVNWHDNGRAIKAAIVDRYPYLNGQWQWVAKNAQHYFQPGVTYSYLTSGRFSARMMDAGAIFDVAGSALFPQQDALAILGLLNSSVAQQLLEAINPTVNFQVGDVGELPVPAEMSNLKSLQQDVARAVELLRTVDAWNPTSPAFVAPLPWRQAKDHVVSVRRELLAVERRIDETIADAFGIAAEPKSAVGSDVEFDRAELARQWVDHTLRRLLRNGEPVRINPIDRTFICSLRDQIEHIDEIESAIGELGVFLQTGFASWHDRIYRRRPVIWALGTSSCAWLVSHDFATHDVMASILRRCRRTLPRGWRRRVDDGIAVNLAPLAEHVIDPALRKALVPIADRLQELDWSETCADITSRRVGARRLVRA
jgi:hypothetical protein